MTSEAVITVLLPKLEVGCFIEIRTTSAYWSHAKIVCRTPTTITLCWKKERTHHATETVEIDAIVYVRLFKEEYGCEL